MARPREAGICVLSIDLDVSGETLRSADHAFRERWEGLRDRFAEAGMPVTWGVSANEAALGQLLLAQPVESEVAVVGDPTWSSEGSSRRAFAEGLAQAVAHFSASGLAPSTLLLPHGRPAPHDDLLVKHGISVIRVGQGSFTATAKRRWGWRSRLNLPSDALRPVRWGLWEAVVTVRVASDGERGVIRAVDYVSQVGGLAIVVAGADRLTANERLKSRLIGHLVRRRDEAALRFETFASLAALQHASRSTPAARSLLHSTAA